MPKMRVAQIPYATGPFELVERDIPEPGAGQVRVKVAACGVCHSDSACSSEAPSPASSIRACRDTKSLARSTRSDRSGAWLEWRGQLHPGSAGMWGQLWLLRFLPARRGLRLRNRNAGNWHQP